MKEYRFRRFCSTKGDERNPPVYFRPLIGKAKLRKQVLVPQWWCWGRGSYISLIPLLLTLILNSDELSAEIFTVLSMADILYLLLASWSI